MEKVIVGKVIKTHGLKGEVKILPLLNDVNMFKTFKHIFIENNSYKVRRCGVTNKKIILGFNEILSVEQAEKLIDKFIQVEKCSINLASNEFFIKDLIDCEIFTSEHKLIGKIYDVQNFGASDIFFIKNGNKQLSLPHIEKVFKNIDFQNKKVVLSNFGEGVLCDED